MKRILLSLLLAASLAGCATSPVTLREANPVTLEGVLSPEYFNPTEERNVKVLIIRDRGLSASMQTALLSINGDPVALLETEDLVTIYLEPKRYLFSVSPVNSSAPDLMGDSDIVVSKDLPNLFRLRVVPDNGAMIERSLQLN